MMPRNVPRIEAATVVVVVVVVVGKPVNTFELAKGMRFEGRFQTQMISDYAEGLW